MNTHTDTRSIVESVAVSPPSCVAVIGGGGKTTLMLRMARELAAGGTQVLVTTTTKIWPPPGLPLICGRHEADPEEAVHRLFGRAQIVVLGDHTRPDGKLHGIPPEEVCRLYAAECAGVVLCEADGSAGRSLKVHRPGEPAVPSCTTVVMSVAGLDAVGRAADSNTIHRPELFWKMTGLGVEDRIDPDHVAQLLIATARFAPPNARVLYVLNKGDADASRIVAGRVVDKLAVRGSRHAVFLTSRGRLLARFDSPALNPARSE